jgi:hypothetical protein
MMEFFSLAWRFRKRLVGIWLVVMVIALMRVLTMQVMYTSECLLVPLSLEQVDEPSQSGLRMPSASKLFSGGGGRDDYTIVAFLRSRQLTDRVIEELELKKELFPDRWDATAGKWIARFGGEPGRQESRRGMSGRGGCRGASTSCTTSTLHSSRCVFTGRLRTVRSESQTAI